MERELQLFAGVNASRNSLIADKPAATENQQSSSKPYSCGSWLASDEASGSHYKARGELNGW